MEMEECGNVLDKDEYLKLGIQDKYNLLIKLMRRSVAIATYGRKEVLKREAMTDKKIKDNEEEKRSHNKFKGNPASWWDKECEEAINNRKQQFGILKKTKLMKDYIEFKRLRAVAKKVIKQKKERIYTDLQQVLTRISA